MPPLPLSSNPLSPLAPPKRGTYSPTIGGWPGGPQALSTPYSEGCSGYGPGLQANACFLPGLLGSMMMA